MFRCLRGFQLEGKEYEVADQLATQSKDIDDVEEWLEEITTRYFSDFVWLVEKQDEAITKLSSNL